jgi:hypothetical protein
MMSRLTILGIGLALAVTATLLSYLCVAVAAVWQAIAFAIAWMRGSDLQLIRAKSPMTLTDFLYGLIAIVALGFVIADGHAWVHNAMGDIGRGNG